MIFCLLYLDSIPQFEILMIASEYPQARYWCDKYEYSFEYGWMGSIRSSRHKLQSSPLDICETLFHKSPFELILLSQLSKQS